MLTHGLPRSLSQPHPQGLSSSCPTPGDRMRRDPGNEQNKMANFGKIKWLLLLLLLNELGPCPLSKQAEKLHAQLQNLKRNFC